MIGFAQALPAIRRTTAEHLRRQGLPREKVLAAVVQLLEKTLIRVGNDEYARAEPLVRPDDAAGRACRGERRHACASRSAARAASSTRSISTTAASRASSRQCRDLPGYELFQYVDEDGERQTVGSADVNAYLQEITGEDFTSKDFRTWAGTVLAAQLLREFEEFDSDAQAKKNIVRAIESVAKRLGNTKAVCRKCYIHPAVLDAYLDGSMMETLAQRARNVSRAVDADRGRSRRARLAAAAASREARNAARNGELNELTASSAAARCGCRRWCRRC